MPPLRKRREDIPGWIGMFLEEKQKKYNRLIHLINGARQYVQDYDWPGNLDQMQCLCERIVLLSEKRNVDEVFLRRNLEEVAPLMTAGRKKSFWCRIPRLCRSPSCSPASAAAGSGSPRSWASARPPCGGI